MTKRWTGVPLAAMFLLASSQAIGAPAGAQTGAPIVLAEQGSFFVGGQTLYTETGNDVVATGRSNPGNALVDQMYVQYQVPAERKYVLPIVLVHGGGHHGKVYETTPDGREGWATYFLRRGFAVYVVDGANRGRSGYDITDISLVRQGAKPIEDLPLIDRYSYERAWTQFRIGPVVGEAFPGSQFPVEAFEVYANQLVPAWRDPREAEKNVAGLVALVDRIGPSILLTWSQSGQFGWHTAIQRPDLIKALVSLEPSGDVPPALPERGLEVLASMPTLFQVGDFDAPRTARLRAFAEALGPRSSVLALPDLGILGNGHVVMAEKNNLQVADLIIARLEAMAAGLRAT